MLLLVIVNNGRLAKNPITTRTHWQCEVRLNELMNEQIFLHWLPSRESITTSTISVLWFWRVVFCLMIDVDIPQLESSGIQFPFSCFLYTYSVQSSSTHSSIISSFDANDLGNYISYGGLEPSPTSFVVKNRTELNSIPLDVEDLWISPFNTTEVSEFSPSKYPSLKTLVIGRSVFWSVTKLELNDHPSLQFLSVGANCFYNSPSFSLTGLIDGLNWICRSHSTTIS